ncbi:hypothetical protein [Desulfatibacillum alkenivorans]|uniref:hypothetical protein n=1 Tax=Desulfatibacillum alkenivorans TaxID=259354 RepID=UPI000935C67A|nr:hypothetical protein [Desulfatibacillum alkenivorans]
MVKVILIPLQYVGGVLRRCGLPGRGMQAFAFVGGLEDGEEGAGVSCSHMARRPRNHLGAGTARLHYPPVSISPLRPPAMYYFKFESGRTFWRRATQAANCAAWAAPKKQGKPCGYKCEGTSQLHSPNFLREAPF